jgi:hypothetical protein
MKLLQLQLQKMKFQKYTKNFLMLVHVMVFWVMICNLFNDVFTPFAECIINADCMASNDWVMVNN